MNPMIKAIDEILFEIPIEILSTVLIPKDKSMCNSALSLESIIQYEVLSPRVLVDIDIQGGTETYIPLTPPVTIEYVDPYTCVYHIPETLTQNRPIRQIYSVHFGILGYQNAGYIHRYAENTISAEARKLLDATLRIPPAQTNYLNLIAPNTVMVRFSYMPTATAYIHCRLGSDPELSFIRDQSIPLFAELCVAAAKAYIYRKARVLVDQAQLSGGQALGVFGDIINEYSDQNEQYKLLLLKWKKIQHCFGDPEARRRHVRTIVGIV